MKILAVAIYLLVCIVFIHFRKLRLDGKYGCFCGGYAEAFLELMFFHIAFLILMLMSVLIYHVGGII